MPEEKREILAEGCEEYPLPIVFIENLFMLSWILLGAFLCRMAVPVAGWIYLAFGLTMAGWVMRVVVCGNCYYHGKLCHVGWGKLSALYCRPGDISRFGKGMGGAMIPVFYGLMAVVPLVFGILSAVKSFSILKAGLILLFLFLVLMSSFVLRKKGCEACRMRNVCPGSAAKLS